MTDLRQAAQQALERLEACVCPPSVHHDIINPLRAALKQQAEPVCWCRKCNENRLVNNIPFSMTRMILCPTCGNKRCPKASDHRLDCTGSNETGQPGSVYPALPQQQAEPVGEVTDAVDGAFKCEFSQHLPVGTKLYTAQPQRKPLSDEEIEQAQRAVWRSLPSDFDYTTSSWIEIGIRYAEAAHGIKEGT